MSKINFPGINFGNIVYPVFPHSYVCGFFVLAFSLTWRAQLATRAKAISFPIKDIPKLDTAKIIAGPIMTNPLLMIVPATSAVFETIIWEGDTLNSSATINEKSIIVHNSAVSLTRYKGPSRVLSLNQINASTLNVHRKGLVSQTIGKCQNEPIHSTLSILQGVDLHNINFTTFFKCFLETCEKVSIPTETLQIIFSEENFNPSYGCNSVIGGTDSNSNITPVPIENLEQAAKTYISKFLSLPGITESLLNINDGLMLSFEAGNFLPIEIGLPIARSSPPSKMSTLDPSLVEKDPFAKLAEKQIQLYNSSIPNSPTTTPEVPATPSGKKSRSKSTTPKASAKKSPRSKK